MHVVVFSDASHEMTLMMGIGCQVAFLGVLFSPFFGIFPSSFLFARLVSCSYSLVLTTDATKVSSSSGFLPFYLALRCHDMVPKLKKRT